MMGLKGIVRGTTDPRRAGGSRAAGILPAAILAFCAILGAASCGAPVPERRAESIFQSTCAVTLYDRKGDADFRAVFDRLKEIDGMMSMWQPTSDLARVNAGAGTGPVAAPPEVLAALAHALRLADLTGGSYDPTVGPLVKLWGIGTPEARVPSRGEIAGALALLGRKNVVADDAAGTIELKRPGMCLDFGSVPKGFGAVEAGKVLEKRGAKSAVVDVGGCVLAFGAKPDGGDWKIGVQNPDGIRGSDLIGYLKARDAAVSTSGIYERRFEANGVVYHHLMDTATGYPIDNGLVSVTILVDRRQNPDGPTLAVFSLGSDAGLALANKLGLAAVLVGKDRTVRLSDAARDRFVLTNSAYSIVK